MPLPNLMFLAGQLDVVGHNHLQRLQDLAGMAGGNQVYELVILLLKVLYLLLLQLLWLVVIFHCWPNHDVWISHLQGNKISTD